MAQTSTYLNFENCTEKAFNFYKSVFGGEFSAEGIMRYGDVPPEPGAPELTDEIKNLVMHMELEILGGHILMGSDAPEAMGFSLKPGNNMFLMLQPDSREETNRFFALLSEGGKIETQLTEMFWGGYYGSCTDKFGITWMFNCMAK